MSPSSRLRVGLRSPRTFKLLRGLIAHLRKAGPTSNFVITLNIVTEYLSVALGRKENSGETYKRQRHLLC